jgi:hypothetical protein
VREERIGKRHSGGASAYDEVIGFEICVHGSNDTRKGARPQGW